MKHYNYYVYITTNPGKTVLYTGVTNDLERRLAEHLQGAGKRFGPFAQRHHCHRLIYYEWYAHIELAISREKEIKGWTRAKKEQLIASFNPEWRFLNDPVEIARGNLPVWHVGDDYWRPSMERMNDDEPLY